MHQINYSHSTQKTVDIPSVEKKINQAISDYQKKPSFDNSTTQLVLGQSATLTDTNGAKISEFDRVVKNTANVDYMVNDNKLIITPSSHSKSDGELVLEKTKKADAPVVYRKKGEQAILVGAIDQTNEYTIKIKVEKDGNLKIVKRDKKSGALVPGTVFSLNSHGVKPKAKKNRTLHLGKNRKAIVSLWLLLIASVSFGLYKNFTAIDQHTTHEKIVEKEIVVNTSGVENFTIDFAKTYFSWRNDKSAIGQRKEKLKLYLTDENLSIIKDMIRPDIPTSAEVLSVKIQDVAKESNQYRVSFEILQIVSEGSKKLSEK